MGLDLCGHLDQIFVLFADALDMPVVLDAKVKDAAVGVRHGDQRLIELIQRQRPAVAFELDGQCFPSRSFHGLPPAGAGNPVLTLFRPCFYHFGNYPHSTLAEYFFRLKASSLVIEPGIPMSIRIISTSKLYNTPSNRHKTRHKSL